MHNTKRVPVIQCNVDINCALITTCGKSKHLYEQQLIRKKDQIFCSSYFFCSNKKSSIAFIK